ncbi:MAG: F0F1 ATP synthase subunit B [Acidobacteria bacterium]|nr:F0F1 ATP synthase subunit B [Acidobacteriota bacterium]
MASENPLLQFEPGLMIWTVITFLATLLVLRKIAWGPLLTALEDRENRIDEALSKAEKARKEAEDAIAQARQDSAAAMRKSEELVKQAKTEAEQLRQKMIEEAKAESQKVVQDGLKRLESEQRAAIQQMRRETADLAIQAASKLVRSSLDERQQRELVDGFLRDLPETRVQ